MWARVRKGFIRKVRVEITQYLLGKQMIKSFAQGGVGTKAWKVKTESPVLLKLQVVPLGTTQEVEGREICQEENWRCLYWRYRQEPNHTGPLECHAKEGTWYPGSGKPWKQYAWFDVLERWLYMMEFKGIDSLRGDEAVKMRSGVRAYVLCSLK